MTIKPLGLHCLKTQQALLEERIIDLSTGPDAADDNVMRRVDTLRSLHAENERFMAEHANDG